jgi:hypothetical protein
VIGMQNWDYPRVMMHPVKVREFMKTQPRPIPDPLGDRGVVLRPIWRHEGGKFQRPADFVLLRKLLLYWDVVVWPQFTTLEKDLDFESKKPYADLDFLGREGVLQLHSVVTGIFGRSTPQINLEEHGWRFQEQTYLNLAFHEPGQWAMAQSSTTFASPLQSTPAADGVLGSLTNMLPSPADGVSYGKILNFRRSNRNALLDFRLHLDELNGQFLVNPDPLLGYTAAHRRLDESIRDLWRLASAQRFETRRITFGTALAFAAGALAGVGLGLTVAPFVGFPLTEAALEGAGLVGGLTGLTYLNEKVANPSEQQGPTAYLLKAIDDEIIEKPPR